MMSISALLLQNDAAQNALAGGMAAIGGMMLLFWLAVAVVCIVGMWKVFVKAGQPGWAVLIPFYNVYVMLQIAGRPGWWLLLFFVPLVNIAIAIVVAIDIAKAFGQSAVFGVVLLFLLSAIGYLVLGFGNYQYRKPALAAAA
ncbi:MAG TPA: DUF5684 domain-containing protein [Candidatus Acidoferrales bacterium]|nr:DUF5684 domain-containing protein [Candidatus Acidoferrales bacterium]